MDTIFDTAIIGGGINGCGCAADASGRGLSVVLLEKDDLASHTSSSSTKLIHGGLRYLEHYEFSLVKKALEERQRLLHLAPYLIHPLAFILPYQKHMRPAWFLKLGLFLYDHLSSKNRLPKSATVKRTEHKSYFKPLKENLKSGILFYDGYTDDARLTLVNAMTAKQQGASIRTHSRVTEITVNNQLWELTVQPKEGPSYTLRAKTLINAAGPWVKDLAGQMAIPVQKMAFVKGSHILVPSLYEGKQGYFLQHEDKRVIFIIPYHGFSMIGTTDVLLDERPVEVQISDKEIDYLLTLVNSYFTCNLSPSDVLHSWSGVRSLMANEAKEVAALSRDYYYELTKNPAPCITIYSGKMTTYRQLAEEVIDRLSVYFPNCLPCKTQKTPLYGSTLGAMDFNQYTQHALNKYQWLDAKLLQRYLFTYGTAMEYFLGSCNNIETLGLHFGNSLYQAEVDYLVSQEWAKNSEDILKRRTKLYLHSDKNTQSALENYLEIC